MIWKPHPRNIPQQEAYECEADEIFYGGRAGGGKTDLLLGLACTAHKRSLILRREASQLIEIIDRSRELLGEIAKFNGTQKVWREIPDGRMIEFGGCEHEHDKQKFKGRGHDLKAFDEVCDFTESQYTFIIGWNRSASKNQRCRVVATGNPPSTAEGEWVLKRWGAWLDPKHPRPAKPGELRWHTTLEGKEIERPNGEPFKHEGETIRPRSRTFIPASLADNPYLAETDYAARLQAMPEPLRSQLLYGDFSVGREDDPWQVIPTEWIQAAMDRWTSSCSYPLDCIGVDVARGGRDKTVISRRHGLWFAPLEKYAGSKTPTGQSVAGLILKSRIGKTPIHVDVIGVGTSVYDQLRGSGALVAGINFAEGSSGRAANGQLSFANLRAEAYWRFREALDPSQKEKVCLPPDSELLSDLAAARFSVQLGGIRVERKEEIVRRIGRSPDCADAVVLAAFTGRSKEVHVFDYGI